MYKNPKNDAKYYWTQHVVDKMRYYAISENLVKRIIRFPQRQEDGIAERTVAVMQAGPNKKKPQEIWVMYQEKTSTRNGTKTKGNDLMEQFLNSQSQQQKIIISTWRYPGISPIGKPLGVPDDVLEALAELSITE